MKVWQDIWRNRVPILAVAIVLLLIVAALLGGRAIMDRMATLER